MSKQELDNLVKIRKLKEEPPSRPEYDGMLTAAKTRLRDAQNEDLDSDSQFDLAYGAAHRLAAATLRREGYRSEDRITVFQTLVHTVGTGALVGVHMDIAIAEPTPDKPPVDRSLSAGEFHDQ